MSVIPAWRARWRGVVFVIAVHREPCAHTGPRRRSRGPRPSHPLPHSICPPARTLLFHTTRACILVSGGTRPVVCSARQSSRRASCVTTLPSRKRHSDPPPASPQGARRAHDRRSSSGNRFSLVPFIPSRILAAIPKARPAPCKTRCHAANCAGPAIETVNAARAAKILVPPPEFIHRSTFAARCAGGTHTATLPAPLLKPAPPLGCGGSGSAARPFYDPDTTPDPSPASPQLLS